MDRRLPELALHNSAARNCARCGKDFRVEYGSKRAICYGCREAHRSLRTRTERGLLGQPLSHREKQVIALIAQAKLNKEIAFELHLTEGTIKEYINRILHKLGIGNRVGLAVWFVTQTKPADGRPDAA